jgi:glycogen operon protein
VLARDERGLPLKDPPILWEIESDPVLAGTKIIAEAWDAAGLYQVGSFVGHRWAEWNGQYRDDLRRFIKGDRETAAVAAARIGGSRDLYPQPDREPNRSINFITCHDGFTLNDLVSYNSKHNQANRQGSRDGADANFSWNCGQEGPADDEAIEALRQRQIRNFLVALFTSQGTPMLLMGDEARRTQGGNNNGYCQDNPVSWFDWEDVHRHGDVLRFVQKLIAFYQGQELFHEEIFWTEPGGPDILWHGVARRAPDWGAESHSLAYELIHPARNEHLFVILNAYWEALGFDLPPLPLGHTWLRVVDTAQPAPQDFADPPVVIPSEQVRYLAQPRSAVILQSAVRPSG